MHPDVCAFISEQIYDGRLDESPELRRPDDRVRHRAAVAPRRITRSARRSRSRKPTSSPTQIAELIGTTWTDQHGVDAPLTADDFMVVAPYNDQVDLLRPTLDADPTDSGRAGRHGRQVPGPARPPVVFFTMTTSSADDMPRGPDFLFSRNRLNVAVSRAQCLAYLVCTDELLNSRARDVDEMQLISTLCAFVEYAEAQTT